jgi:hypothetical protein
MNFIKFYEIQRVTDFFVTIKFSNVGVAYSRSDAVVTMGPVDASESEIRTAKNCVTGGIESKTSALILC